MSIWSPTSWREKPILQQPTYPNQEDLKQTLDTLKGYPPLVFAGEARSLKKALGDVAHGQAFLLQGGDCAESFDECTAEPIANKLKILLQMSLVLVHGLKKRVIRVGRMAGQYAKPRSLEHETRNGVTLPSYRGDIINALDFDAAAREPELHGAAEPAARSGHDGDLSRQRFGRHGRTASASPSRRRSRRSGR